MRAPQTPREQNYTPDPHSHPQPKSPIFNAKRASKLGIDMQTNVLYRYTQLELMF